MTNVGNARFHARSGFGWLWAAALCLGCGWMGCATPAPSGGLVTLSNPAQLPALDHDFVWDQVVDVVDDYFTIDREERVKLVGDVLTPGRLDTFPEVGSTLLEPWRGDSVGGYNRLEATLQSIRRRAIVQVVPTAGGYLLDVAVFKELEDVLRPENSPTGAATFRNDDSIDRFPQPIGEQVPTVGWIPQGRDLALEQQIIAAVEARLGGAVVATPPLPQ